MRALASLVGFIGLLSLAMTAAAQNASPGVALGPASIEVMGEGIVHAVPEVARVRLGVEVLGSGLAAAHREADQRIGAVVRTLRAAGVPEAHIHTVGLGIQPQYETRDGQPSAGIVAPQSGTPAASVQPGEIEVRAYVHVVWSTQ
jgi:uncharacterized protein YggE